MRGVARAGLPVAFETGGKTVSVFKQQGLLPKHGGPFGAVLLATRTSGQYQVQYVNERFAQKYARQEGLDACMQCPASLM